MKRAKAEVASIVREENDRHMKAEMIKNVQQLRLKEPDMVRKEYRALVQQVQDRESQEILLPLEQVKKLPEALSGIKSDFQLNE